MARIRWSVVGLVLMAAAAMAQSNATDAILAGLNDQPMSPVLIREIKAEIPNQTDPHFRCKLGVLYALGCLASGNPVEGLATRGYLTKAFPHDELLQELTDDRICGKCPACQNGKILDPCPQCNGTGKCPACKGTGQQNVQGMGTKPRKVKCMYCPENPGKCRACGGTKGSFIDCPRCAGTGLVGSVDKSKVLYLRLLKAMAPPKQSKNPVIMVVTAAPPAEVAEDPEVAKKEWVTRSLEAAKAQTAASSILQKYTITAEDIRTVRNPDLTGAQKEEALNALRKRGLTNPARGSYFFLPFPAGLRYCVAGVQRNPYGGYFLKLTSTPPARNPPKEALTPRDALGETAKAICEPLGDFLSDPTVCVSDADAGTAALRKGEAIESGAWLIPVLVSPWGTLDREGTCYRSQDEAMAQLGLGR